MTKEERAELEELARAWEGSADSGLIGYVDTGAIWRSSAYKAAARELRALLARTAESEPKRGRTPDFLDVALNEGDGVYRP